MLKACVIGMGPIGTIHAGVYAACDGARLVAVCDRNEERARAAGDARSTYPGICRPRRCWSGTSRTSAAWPPAASSMRATITSPPCRRCRPARTCCARSRSPTTWAGPWRWWRRRGALDRCLAIDLNHRFTPAARSAKRWQDEGRLGDLLFVNMALWIGKFGPLDSEYYHLKALNPHSVDIMRYFCGDVETRALLRHEGAGAGRSGARRQSTCVPQRRGRPSDELIRHRARASHGALRGGRHQGAAGDRGYVARGHAVSGGGSGEARLHQPGVRRLQGLRGYLPRSDRPRSCARWPTAYRRRRSMAAGQQGLAATRVIHAAIASLKTGLPVTVDDVTE